MCFTSSSSELHLLIYFLILTFKPSSTSTYFSKLSSDIILYFKNSKYLLSNVLFFKISYTSFGTLSLMVFLSVNLTQHEIL